MHIHPKNLIILAIPVVVWTCGKGLSGLDRSEGSVIYDVSYPFEEGNLMTELMPNSTTMYFKNHQTYSELRSVGGLMSVTLHTNNESKSITQVLKDFDRRYMLELDESESIEWLQMQQEPMSLEYTDRTEIIAGYPCKVALAHYQTDTIAPVELYYTDQIEIKSPNWFTNYAPLDGVLLGYDLDWMGLRMRFRAREVKFGKVDSELFVTRPASAVNMESMDTICTQLMAEFGY
ncbi:MAG: hypothetical protein RL220_357 [Bacteroidota bacterium]